MATWLINVTLISFYQILIIIFGTQYDPESEVPWWVQLKSFQIPKGEGVVLGILCLVSGYMVSVFATSLTVPANSSQLLIPFINYLTPFMSYEYAAGIIAVAFYIIATIITTIFIQLALVVTFETWENYETKFKKKWNNILKFWYEGVLLYIAFPIALIIFMLGGTLLIFFPVLIINFLTNGIALEFTGSWMTQLIEILLLTSLFIYPIYPALTWGQYYKSKLNPGSIDNSNELSGDDSLMQTTTLMK
jgi:hypothetical protein